MSKDEPTREAPMSTTATKTDKEELIELLQRLPDNATVDEIMDVVEIWERLKVSDRSIQEGRVFTHEEIKERMKQWLLP